MITRTGGTLFGGMAVYAVALALEKNPEAGRAMVEAGWEGKSMWNKISASNDH